AGIGRSPATCADRGLSARHIPIDRQRARSRLFSPRGSGRSAATVDRGKPQQSACHLFLAALALLDRSEEVRAAEQTALTLSAKASVARVRANFGSFSETPSISRALSAYTKSSEGRDCRKNERPEARRHDLILRLAARGSAWVRYPSASPSRV